MQAQNRTLTEQIVAQGVASTAAAKVAATVTKATLTPEESQAWMQDLETRLETIRQCPEKNLGHIEEEMARSTREQMRIIAERSAQITANQTPCRCSQHDTALTDQKWIARTIDSRFGSLRIFRHYGWCEKCQEWHFPADYALGLQRKASASPYIQEICALLTTKMPPEQAVAVAARFGLDLSRCRLDREAHRQGLKAQAARDQFTAQLDAWEDFKALARHTDGPPSQPFTLVIQIDAWNIRERDDWGKTEELLQKKEKPSRYHWVYMATVFRLDHRGQTAGGRAVISERGYAATRLGVEALIRQLYREAHQRGLGQAKQVLVIADGAVWIWNAAKDRFGDALQRLDLYHADEHLWEVANDLYGKGTPEARAWVAPLLLQVRDDQTTAVMATLDELKPRLQEAQQKKLQTEIEYLQNNAHRMKYKEIMEARLACKNGVPTPEQLYKAQEPLGSGAIESTCRQYQCRFKRTGQFWSMSGDEALLCLETFWRNDRWHELYPHAKPAVALN